MACIIQAVPQLLDLEQEGLPTETQSNRGSGTASALSQVSIKHRVKHEDWKIALSYFQKRLSPY